MIKPLPTKEIFSIIRIGKEKIIAKKVTKSPAKEAKKASEVKKEPATKKAKSTVEKDDESTATKKSKTKDTVKTQGAKDATAS